MYNCTCRIHLKWHRLAKKLTFVHPFFQTKYRTEALVDSSFFWQPAGPKQLRASRLSFSGSHFSTYLMKVSHDKSYLLSSLFRIQLFLKARFFLSIMPSLSRTTNFPSIPQFPIPFSVLHKTVLQTFRNIWRSSRRHHTESRAGRRRQR